MSAGMAEVIAAVLAAEEPRGNDIRRWPKDEVAAYRDAGGFMRGNEAARALQVSKLAAHVAEDLEKAGYGNVQEAKAEAFDKAVSFLRDRGKWARSEHGPYVVKTGYDSDGHGHDAQMLDEWYADWLEQFPYSDPLAAALADPEGHALVKAIHDRKAEG